MRAASALFLHRIRRALRHEALPIWILEELLAGPSYGYELLVRLRTRHGTDLSVGPSILYPALARLRSAGLVRSFHGTTSRGPLRKYYDLTEEGRRLLPSLQALGPAVPARAGAPSRGNPGPRGASA
ncbi:MAG: PadR family transcriptional regulator [Thermoplasmata archaeon]|nr:PadR family transcriptional regulator [Thermoplasmata archaeon]MCI4354470.1 PadR family transcriptional regulator [Thermoplasmata archaeon]